MIERVVLMVKSWQVQNADTLFDFLLRYSGISKKALKAFIKSGQVMVNDEICRQSNSELKVGDVIVLAPEKPKQSDLPFEILYEDDDLIAINKPAGLLSMASDSEKEKTAYHLVRSYLKSKDSKAMVFVVHRLDRDTSGVLLFAKNERIKRQLQDHWNELVKVRGYQALVEGKFKQDHGTLKHYLSESKTQQVYVSNAKTGKLAITHYRVLETYKDTSLLEIELATGRKNQIRVQMAHIGHPLVGDRKYNPKGIRNSRLCLHAHRLVIHDFRCDKDLEICAGAPNFGPNGLKNNEFSRLFIIFALSILTFS